MLQVLLDLLVLRVTQARQGQLALQGHKDYQAQMVPLAQSVPRVQLGLQVQLVQVVLTAQMVLLVLLDQSELQVPLDHKVYKEFKAIQVLLAQLVLLDLSEPLDRKE